MRGALTRAGVRAEIIELAETATSSGALPLDHSVPSAAYPLELDTALLEGRIDLAVHCLDEVPVGMIEGLTLLAVADREDPRDALVGRELSSWAGLSQGATIAAAGIHRRGQLLRARPDLHLVQLRGGVTDGLTQLAGDSSLSAVVVSVADLSRLGFLQRISGRLGVDLVLPAPGQGALAIVARKDDGRCATLVAPVLHQPRNGSCVMAERGFHRRLGGGVAAPVAALATWAEPGLLDQGWIELAGRIVSRDGSRMIEGVISEPIEGALEAENLGARLAEDLMAQGAVEILEEVEDYREEEGSS